MYFSRPQRLTTGHLGVEESGVVERAYLSALGCRALYTEVGRFINNSGCTSDVVLIRGEVALS
jgi:hypothetical protein